MENFRYLSTHFAFLKWALNSLIVASTVTLLVLLLLGSWTAFALAALNFRGSRALFALIVGILFVPIEVTRIPLSLPFARIHNLDHLSALILPTVANVAGMFILVRFFESLPRELIDATIVDDTSHFRIWRAIVLPLARLALAVVAVITFVSGWNNLLRPLIVVNSNASRTLPVGIAQLSGGASGVSGLAPQYAISMATSLAATLPALLVFLLLQPHFVRSIATTGLKG